ncbi:substrate-binding periplasmic protein [Rhodovibrionaceae bacterium A322]
MKKAHFLFVSLCFAIFTTGNALADQLSLAVADNTIDTVVSEVIVKKAYELLGHDVEIIRLPPKRALIMANVGSLDGDVQRIHSVANTYSSLIRLEPPINYILGTGFILRGSNVKVTSWQDLSMYRVGIIQGIRFAETNVPEESAVVFYDYDELANALLDRTIDIGIYPLSNGRYQSLLINQPDIIPLDKPLARFELYHYLHEKHRNLVPHLQEVFASFQQDGLLEKVRASVLEISLERARQGKEPCYPNYDCYRSVWEE